MTASLDGVLPLAAASQGYLWYLRFDWIKIHQLFSIVHRVLHIHKNNNPSPGIEHHELEEIKIRTHELHKLFLNFPDDDVDTLGSY
jgi:hypothetical protein